ncbi:hypothetical protein HF576_08810 [Microbacterium sp. CFH 90308]|uniref:Uncharacterized protein n=1 Tax=Microbacterium salsuginis TaxID=2722803 RepID=A0ABX1KBR5_9MICO|nr:hypothetical protein [Microbacterium sp. CFH 90308]NLP83947.1 hypothetical protein [Microbacterium sp. CFH 90308]
MFNILRRRFDAAVARRIDRRLNEHELESRRVHDEARRVHDDYEARLGGLQADYDFLRSEFDRIAPQLAAVEYRLERQREGRPVNDEAQVSAELEHERARLRLELASHYEERLRRLEEAQS